jgi:hypothetical protein
MIPKKQLKDLARHCGSTDASCIGNKRGMARKAKRKGGKTVRQFLRKEDNSCEKKTILAKRRQFLRKEDLKEED